jgi:hypothetical protein
MKTKTNPVRLLIATAVLGLLASTSYAGPGLEYWQNRTKPITTFSEAHKMGPDDMAMMQCKGCKTAMVHTSKHVGAPRQRARCLVQSRLQAHLRRVPRRDHRCEGQD